MGWDLPRYLLNIHESILGLEAQWLFTPGKDVRGDQNITLVWAPGDHDQPLSIPLSF